jgi:aspartate carbamoyltransferase
MATSPAFTPIAGNFIGKDIVSIAQFSRTDVDKVMAVAETMASMVHIEGRSELLRDKVFAHLFYEPSTRTFMSFEAAAKRLGAATIAVQGVENSSLTKGETLEDTIRTAERYADIIVMRHKEAGAAAVAAAYAGKPVINAGDGVGEHPTQALLDVFTITEKASKPPEGLSVTMLGDLKNGRTVHSLARLLALYDARLNYVSPEQLQMPPEVTQELDRLGILQYVTTDLDEVLGNTDVLYATRLQKERFEDKREYQKLQGSYTINSQTMSRAPKDMILMHPLPRVDEIDMAVDVDPRAVYFDEVENGMYVRMALLALVMGRSY